MKDKSTLSTAKTKYILKLQKLKAALDFIDYRKKNLQMNII